MDYGEVLSKAWKILWKFKVLWIFGILASCGTSQSSNFSFNNNFQTNGNGSYGSMPNLPPAVLDALSRFGRLFDSPNFIWEFIAGALAVVCIIILVEIFIGTMGRIGLIKGSAEADAGAEKLTFGGLWKESLPYFWRVFWLSLLVGSPFVIAIIALAAGVVAALVPLSNTGSNGQYFLILLPVMCVFFCIIIILAVLVGFISTQAERAIVLENKSILDGFRRGWEVLTKNLGSILIIWLITVVIGIAAAILIILPFLAVFVPLFMAFIGNTNNVNFSLTPWIAAFVCILCVYGLISWFANGILVTYLQSVWTLTYIRLTKPKQEEETPAALPTHA
jgi:hypothetical protein